MKRLLLVLSLSLTLSLSLFAQPTRYALALSGGYTLPNSEEWSYVSSATFGVAGTMAWQFKGDDYWTPLRHNPLFGLRVEWLHANNAIAGERFGLQGFLQQPLFTTSDGAHQLSWTLDGGISLYTRPYRRTFDDPNIFIGSYINCLIGAGVQMTSRISSSTSLTYGVRFCHASNGYLRKPNQGLNYIQAEVGYGFHSDSAARMRSQHLVLPPSHLFLSYAPGLVPARNGLSDQLYFFTHTAQIGYLFNLSPLRAVGANVDFMFNYSHNAIADDEGVPRPFPLYVGIAANYETSWDRLFFRVALGAYLYKSQLCSYPIYERMGIYYRFGSHLHQYAGVAFKAHYAHVDYIEWTYGIELF